MTYIFARFEIWSILGGGQYLEWNIFNDFYPEWMQEKTKLWLYYDTPEIPKI